jgi:2,3-bisphosphoglycerate-independent phosphoglycerate mutase
MIGEQIRNLIQRNSTKIVLVVLDGVGDIPDSTGMTALEQASAVNLDSLAKESQLGLTEAVDVGITPGSGPAHLSLFGYDPLKYDIGRGVLEALGIGIALSSKDLAARANFATRDNRGIITDRRAGRIATEKNAELCGKINSNLNRIQDIDVKVYPGKEHRFVTLFSGEGLSDNLLDADPQETGKPEVRAKAMDGESGKAETIANEFIEKVRQILKDERPANTCLLRGLAKAPEILKFEDLFGLKACAVASYPMYKGLSRLVGMDVVEGLATLSEQVDKLKELYNKYDYFYVHIKKTDSYGEDGSRDSKVKVIEEFDKLLPRILDLSPDVLCVTSDHSTPTPMKGHSWHPNPILIKGPYMRRDQGVRFTESECLKGVLGRFFAKDVMQLILSQAGRLKKFGA